LRMLEEDWQGAAETVAEARAVLWRLAGAAPSGYPLCKPLYLGLKNAIPATASTIRATSRTTANGMRMTSAALPVVV
jgi:hypothetical protein